MNQLGNLAIVVAKHKDCALNIYDESATVFVGHGSERRIFSCNVWDDEYIDKIIAFLNYGIEIK